MFVTDHAFFKHFWYPVIPVSALHDGPKAFTLLEHPLVLWLNDAGEPCATEDRCSHRAARLSCGQVVEGSIRCPYHGWAFNKNGDCILMPQWPEKSKGPNHPIRSFQACERYGYVWVALADPLKDIPEFAEDADPDFRRIPCFYESWNTSPIRTMENELDMAHFSFVHRGTFGDNQSPRPLSLKVEDLDDFHLRLTAALATVAPPEQANNTKMPEGSSQRTMRITWYMPFTVKLEIGYASGLRHIVINNSTPISAKKIQVVQFHFRDDSEADVSTEQLIAFEKRIVAEDRFVLENTDPDVNLFDYSQEAHMATDQAGLLMRNKLKHAIRRYETTPPLPL